MSPFVPPLSDRQLLDLSSRGRLDAAEALVDRHLGPALALARRLAGPAAPADRVLDAVHDAFITAFDEAIESGLDSIDPTFRALLRELALSTREDHERGAPAHDAPAGDADGAAFEPRPVVISATEARQLREEILIELRLTIAIHVQTPRSWHRGRGLAYELRVVRRRLRARLEALHARLPTAIVRPAEPR